MWNQQQLEYRAEKYDRFVEYILAEYGSTNQFDKWSLTKDHCYEIQRLSFILGKMHVYMNDRHDMEQANLALKWFEKAFNETYDLSDFKQWMADNPEA